MSTATDTTPAADDPDICATIQTDDQQQHDEHEQPSNQTQAHTAPATTPKPPRMPSKAANTPDPPQHTTQTPERRQDPATGRESASEGDEPLLAAPKQAQTTGAEGENSPATARAYMLPRLPSVINLKPYPISKDLESELEIEGNQIELSELGESQAHALGFLSALIETGRFGQAVQKTGLRWSIIHRFCAACPDYQRLYKAVMERLNETRVQLLRDVALDRALVGTPRGIYWNGQKVAEEVYPSDKMTELLLRGLDPETFGAAGESGPAVAVQVNIGV